MLSINVNTKRAKPRPNADRVLISSNSVSPVNRETIWTVTVVTVSKGFIVKFALNPAAITTIIVSPIALLMANKKAPTRPGKAAGNTTFKVVSALVAPSPKEPSLKDCGTELIISSDNDDINGIIIIPITAPAAKADSELTSSPSDIPTILKNGAAVKAAK